MLVLGGWPGTLGRSDAAIRKNVEGYCHRIVNGTSQLPGDFIPNPERMVAVLTSLSRNVSTTASKASILADVTSSGRSMSRSTLDRYLAYLRRNYVIEDLPNWSPKLRTKTVIRSSPVHHFFDPAIAAMFLDATPTDPERFRDVRISVRIDGRARYQIVCPGHRWEGLPLQGQGRSGMRYHHPSRRWEMGCYGSEARIREGHRGGCQESSEVQRQGERSVP